MLIPSRLRDFLRIVAPNKTSYEMRYFNINDDKDEEEWRIQDQAALRSYGEKCAILASGKCPGFELGGLL